jgi:hypothetical protein
MAEVERDVLRQARLAAGLQLRHVVERTRLSPAIVARIDRGDFEQLPAGIYARSYVRAYSSAVGRDGDEIVRRLQHLLPSVVDPVEALGCIHRRQDLPRRSSPKGSPGLPRRSSSKASEGGRPYAVAVVDVLFLIALDVGVLCLVAIVCGVPVRRLVSVSGLPIGAVFATVAALYYVLLGRIGHLTFGARLLDIDRRDTVMPAIASTAPANSHDAADLRATIVG